MGDICVWPTCSVNWLYATIKQKKWQWNFIGLWWSCSTLSCTTSYLVLHILNIIVDVSKKYLSSNTGQTLTYTSKYQYMIAKCENVTSKHNASAHSNANLWL